MAEPVFPPAFEHAGVHRLLGDCLKGQGLNELGGVFGEDHIDRGAALNELAGQISGLVGGDAARDAECYS